MITTLSRNSTVSVLVNLFLVKMERFFILLFLLFAVCAVNVTGDNFLYRILFISLKINKNIFPFHILCFAEIILT
jgi:hypothetical protein